MADRRRLSVLLMALAVTAIAAAGAYARHVSNQSDTAPPDDTKCAGGTQPRTLTPTRLGDVEQAAVLAIVRADPIVTAVAGPDELTVLTGRQTPHAPGITMVPRAVPLHGEQVGPIVMVHVQLAQPFPRAVLRWRTFGATLRDECNPDTIASAWTQVAEGTPAADAAELYVTVSLAHKRTLEVTPIPSGKLQPIGEREYIVGAR